MGVEAYDTCDRAAADGAEAYLVPGEHDAIHRGSVESLGLVRGTLETREGDHYILKVQHPGHQRLLFPEKGLKVFLHRAL